MFLRKNFPNELGVSEGCCSLTIIVAPIPAGNIEELYSEKNQGGGLELSVKGIIARMAIVMGPKNAADRLVAFFKLSVLMP
jgi:hypothetical protein